VPSLDELPFRVPARIVSVGGERGFRRRLFELGFLPDVEVTVLGAAPLGDPLDLEVRGCRFSLRRAEAAVIGVRPLPAPAASPAGEAAR
jgi:ferrous iron transport protein A